MGILARLIPYSIFVGRYTFALAGSLPLSPDESRLSLASSFIAAAAAFLQMSRFMQKFKWPRRSERNETL